MPFEKKCDNTVVFKLGGGELKEFSLRSIGMVLLQFLLKLFLLAAGYFLIELFAVVVLHPAELTGLLFGALWALMLSGIVLLLPRLAGKIVFGITYYFYLLWTLAQTGYWCVFRKMMWLSDIFFLGEGAAFFSDILGSFPLFWWIGGLLLIAGGVLVIMHFPQREDTWFSRIPWAITAVAALAGLIGLPELVFLKDLDIWGTHSEYAQSSSYRATYNTMYSAGEVYEICGIYQLTFRDIWKHELYPLTPAYLVEQQEQISQIDSYFKDRGSVKENEMTGLFAGKNVVLVLMESMDDWMITPDDTPTLYRMMDEGINFTEFYTPGYGTARTINSEFCVNTGIYLPTNGRYVFDYVTNTFDQSVASRAVANGYSAEVFHYNNPEFYSRGVFEPAMGYGAYNCYEDYTQDADSLYDDCLLFEIPELSELFFREGQTFNTIITRSAHLSYVYREVLSNYALKQYPQYRGMYSSEEEDCARVKAKLVDDLFARLVRELKAHGQLENTVIIGVTDHYTYGYKNTQELYAHSGVKQELLLEKTPCFVWSADCPRMAVDKTLHTADFLPTVLNLLGYESPYSYLGQDAFDPSYVGYALFPDGSWISDGVVFKADTAGTGQILQNLHGKQLTEEYLQEMSLKTREFINVSNLLLTSDYYKEVR